MQIIRIADDAGQQVWDAFVSPRSYAVTDLPPWSRVVEGAYGLRSHRLAALAEQSQAGALSLLEVKHPLFGHYLTTAPFGNDGGLHFDSPEARDLLLDEARRLADERDVDYLLIRTRDLDLDGFVSDRRYCTAVIDLEGGAEALWERLKAKARNQVRRGRREGFRVESGPQQVGPFFRVFHRHMRDLGSPAHSWRFYQLILSQLSEQAEFIVVRDGDEVAAGALVFWVNETAMDYHTVALRKFNRRCPNYLIYWEMLERSCRQGCRWFDMGRSLAGSSVLRFKQNWGPEVVPLSYNYYLRTRKEPPNLDPRNPIYRVPIALWRKLPLVLTRRLGPRLISGLA